MTINNIITMILICVKVLVYVCIIFLFTAFSGISE